LSARSTEDRPACARRNRTFLDPAMRKASKPAVRQASRCGW
jgi:hypothetical protein